MTNWTPETNRIPFGLLTDEEKKALQAWLVERIKTTSNGGHLQPTMPSQRPNTPVIANIPDGKEPEQ